mmetsp:Transcript_22626/g.63559  ORF Transcript_22626/g.63559 Transcript_22626/m.63559 type:complete len:277 (+) Transcript_22626:2608-3438(+)
MEKLNMLLFSRCDEASADQSGLTVRRHLNVFCVVSLMGAPFSSSITTAHSGSDSFFLSLATRFSPCRITTSSSFTCARVSSVRLSRPPPILYTFCPLSVFGGRFAVVAEWTLAGRPPPPPLGPRTPADAELGPAPNDGWLRVATAARGAGAGAGLRPRSVVLAPPPPFRTRRSFARSPSTVMPHSFSSASVTSARSAILSSPCSSNETAYLAARSAGIPALISSCSISISVCYPIHAIHPLPTTLTRLSQLSTPDSLPTPLLLAPTQTERQQRLTD